MLRMVDIVVRGRLGLRHLSGAGAFRRAAFSTNPEVLSCPTDETVSPSTPHSAATARSEFWSSDGCMSDE